MVPPVVLVQVMVADICRDRIRHEVADGPTVGRPLPDLRRREADPWAVHERDRRRGVGELPRDECRVSLGIPDTR